MLECIRVLNSNEIPCRDPHISVSIYFLNMMTIVTASNKTILQ